MLKKKASIAVLGITAVLLPWTVGTAGPNRATTDVSLAVPVGITLVDVPKATSRRAFDVAFRRLGDADGNPLYTYGLEGNAGQPHCFDDCAKQFPPVFAPGDAVAFGEWSLINRPEGKQWAYRGQPLYRYAGQRGNDNAFQPVAADFSPKAGWKQAVYDPAKAVPTPADIRLQSYEAATGYAFVVASTGMPLYILKNDPKDTSEWTPLHAAAVALPVGDFSIVGGTDGTDQWAYKGQRLYTYNGDYTPSDINGLTQKGARIALAYRFYIPPEIAINVYPMHPPMMTTAKGISVYTEARYHLQYGGKETRGGYHVTYNEGKELGTRACPGDCPGIWRPVAAPQSAKSWGFWEVDTRPDGSKQWAYKGAALYTYVGDKTPGDINGNNRDVIVYGDAHGKTMSVIGDGFSAAEGDTGANNLLTVADADSSNPAEYYVAARGAGFYWHLVPLQ